MKKEELDLILYKMINQEIERIGEGENNLGKAFINIMILFDDYNKSLYVIDSKHDLLKAVIKEIKEQENRECGNYYSKMGELLIYGLPKDYKKAKKLYRMGAIKKNKDAYYGLGYIYEEIENNPNKAKEYYEKALKLGSKDMQYKIGKEYAEGNCGERNLGEALKWYRKSAEQGHNKAQYELAYMYEKGIEIEQDYLVAAKLYKKCCYMMDKNYKEIHKWPMGKETLDYRSPYYRLGRLYEKGKGVTQDYLKAIELYEQVAWTRSEFNSDKIAQKAESNIIKIVEENSIDYNYAYKERLRLFESWIKSENSCKE